MKLLVNLYMYLLLLVLTIVLYSILLYCIVLYCIMITVILFCMVCHADTILSDLQRIQNTAARILTKCGDRNYPSINLLKKLHWLPVRQRITYKILILTVKTYHKTAPQYICDLIIPRT